MDAGKVILIHTAKDLLKQSGTEIFGRFFIALLGMAVQERAVLPRKKPCFVYIDECQDYIASDPNFTVILEQARKQNVGVVVAHQYLSQLQPRVFDALAANTSIKFVGGVSDQDARRFASMLRRDVSFIERQSKGCFAVQIRNFTDRAVSHEIPFGTMERLPKADETTWQRTLERNRARYAPSSEASSSEEKEPLADQPNRSSDKHAADRPRADHSEW